MTDPKLLRLAARGVPYPEMQKTAGKASWALRLGKKLNPWVERRIARAAKPGLLRKMLASGSRSLVHMSGKAPMETAMLGGLTAIGGLGVLEAGAKRAPAAKKTRQIAAQAISRPQHQGRNVYASVKFDRDSVERLRLMRDQLEKQASIRAAAQAGGAATKAAPKSPRSFGDWLKMGIAAGIAGSAIGAGQQMMSYGIGKATQRASAKNRGKHYNAMLRADPSLKQNKLSQTYFNVLHRASPYVASEPVIAAATVRTMLETPSIGGRLPTVTHRTMKDILETEEARQKSEMPFFRRSTKPDMPNVPSVQF